MSKANESKICNGGLTEINGSKSLNCFTLEILQIVKDAQMQHGLRHGDYQRYRQYCSMRLRRMRKSLHYMQGTKHKVVPKKISAEVVKDSKYLLLPLFEAERSWAYAMELKSESNTQRHKKFHMMSRLRKAAEHSSHLQSVVSDERLNCNAVTKLEANAYCCWMKGLLELERQDWKIALDNLNKSRMIYEKLAETVLGDAKEIYQQRCVEISPNVRYCEYNIGDESAIEDLVEMRRTIGSEDPLISNLDELIVNARERQSESLSEVPWLGRVIPVKNSNVKRVLHNLLQNDDKLLSKKSFNEKLSLYESQLSDIIMATQSLKDDLKDDANFKSAISKGQSHAGPATDAVYLHSYLCYLRMRTYIDKTLVLIQKMKNQEEAKKCKPLEFAKLYENIMQNLSEIMLLPGLEGNKFLDEIQVEISEYKAYRAFHIAESHCSVKKWKEALALYNRSFEYCTEAVDKYSKLSSANLNAVEKATTGLKDLMQQIDGLRYFVNASYIINDQEVGIVKAKPVNISKPMFERLDEYVEVPTNNLKKVNLIPFPTDFEPIPAKPFFFDIALSLIQFPSLEDKFDQKKQQPSEQKKRSAQAQEGSQSEQKAQGGGITKLFSKWLWGGEASSGQQ